jgi:hypothetical protein
VNSLDVECELTGYDRLQGETWAGKHLSIEDQKLALLAWGSLLARMKRPEEMGVLDAGEVDRALGVLQAIVAAVVATRTRRHLRVVPKGEP